MVMELIQIHLIINFVKEALLKGYISVHMGRILSDNTLQLLGDLTLSPYHSNSIKFHNKP